MTAPTPTRAIEPGPVDAVASVQLVTASEPEARRPRGARRARAGLWLALGWLVIVLGAAVLADVLPVGSYERIVTDLPPRATIGASASEPLGTDALGRSTTSRLVYGARQTITVGLLATAGAMVFGTVIGMAAGYFRGKPEAILNVLLDAMLSIPPLVMLLTVAAVGRRDISTVVVGLVIVGTPTFARLARATTLRLRNRPFVTAARAMGARTSRIILREVMPTVVLGLSSFAFLFMGVVVVVEGSLSFLGLGIPPPAPSWGGMINDSRQYLQDAPHLVFVPCICLVLTVVSLSTIGDRLRRRLDARGLGT